MLPPVYHEEMRRRRAQGDLTVMIPPCTPERCFCEEAVPAGLIGRVSTGSRGRILAVTATHIKIAPEGWGTMPSDRLYRRIGQMVSIRRGEVTLPVPASPRDLLAQPYAEEG